MRKLYAQLSSTCIHASALCQLLNAQGKEKIELNPLFQPSSGFALKKAKHTPSQDSSK